MSIYTKCIHMHSRMPRTRINIGPLVAGSVDVADALIHMHTRIHMYAYAFMNAHECMHAHACMLTCIYEV